MDINQLKNSFPFKVSETSVSVVSEHTDKFLGLAKAGVPSKELAELQSKEAAVILSGFQDSIASFHMATHLDAERAIESVSGKCSCGKESCKLIAERLITLSISIMKLVGFTGMIQSAGRLGANLKDIIEVCEGSTKSDGSIVSPSVEVVDGVDGIKAGLASMGESSKIAMIDAQSGCRITISKAGMKAIVHDPERLHDNILKAMKDAGLKVVDPNDAEISLVQKVVLTTDAKRVNLN